MVKAERRTEEKAISTYGLERRVERILNMVTVNKSVAAKTLKQKPGSLKWWNNRAISNRHILWRTNYEEQWSVPMSNPT